MMIGTLMKISLPTFTLIFSFSLILIPGNIFPLIAGKPSTCDSDPVSFQVFFHLESSIHPSQLAPSYQQIQVLSLSILAKILLQQNPSLGIFLPCHRKASWKNCPCRIPTSWGSTLHWVRFSERLWHGFLWGAFSNNPGGGMNEERLAKQIQ